MAQVSFPTSSQSSLIQDWPKMRVSVRKNWADDWKVQVYLEVIEVTECCAPTIPKAVLRWRAGEVAHEDGGASDDGSLAASGFATEPAKDLSGYFVKIEFLGAAAAKSSQGIWVGRIVETATHYGGDLNAAASADSVTPIDQELIAYGLEKEMQRRTISGAFATNDGSSVIAIGTPLVFNEKYTLGLSPLGNRSTAQVSVPTDTDVGHADTYLFARADETSPNNSVWNHLDILNYLIAFYWATSVNIPLNPGGLASEVLKAIQLPHVELDGLTLYEAINRLIDRRRGIGWELRYHDSSDAFTLFVHTVFEQDVTTSDGQKIPKNAEIGDLNLESNNRSLEADVDELVIRHDDIGEYGTITVEGERLVSCFTLSVKDGTLEKAWTDTDETNYQKATGDASPENSTVKIDRERASEKYRNVYTTFRVKKDWDWTVGGQICNPSIKDDGSLDTKNPAPTRTWGHTFLRTLPFLKPPLRDSYSPEFVEPMVFMDSPTTQQPVNVENPGDDSLKTCHPRASDSEFAIIVHFSPAYYLARNHWSTDATTGSIDLNDPLVAKTCYDYSTLKATVAARTDARLRVRETIANRDPTRELVLRVPDAEFWFVVPNTIKDVTKGKFDRFVGRENESGFSGLIQQIQTFGGIFGSGSLFLRDDASILRRVAAMAKVWYSKTRSAVTFNTRAFIFGIRAGSYLRNILRPTTAIDVQTVVTAVTWNLEKGTTTIQTDYAEMDFTASREDLPALRA